MTTIQPKAGLHFPKPADFGQLLHVVTLTLVPALAILGVATNEQLTGWIALGFAVIDPLFSTLATPDKARAIIYGLGGITQAVLIGIGTLEEAVAQTVVGAVVTALLASMATFFTPTSTLVVDTQE